MAKLIASVTFEGKQQVMEHEGYTTKKDFAYDLRANGYKVRFISFEGKFEEDAENYYWACRKNIAIKNAMYASDKRLAERRGMTVAQYRKWIKEIKERV